MTKENNCNLPAYTTAENIFSLLEVLKRKNKSEDEAKALFGKGDSAYKNTKSALRAFNLIENESLEFTEKGRTVAYSEGSDMEFEIIEIIKSFPPYEAFLYSLLQKEDVTKTEINEIVNFWGKANYGSTQRNREDAAKLFMSIIDFVGFGKYIIGRGNNQTRIEWAADIKDKIAQLYIENNDSQSDVKGLTEYTHEENYVDVNEVEKVPVERALYNDKKRMAEPVIKLHTSKVSLPNITINVDMSNWSDEKIKIFFKYAYGIFEEDDNVQ